MKQFNAIKQPTKLLLISSLILLSFSVLISPVYAHAGGQPQLINGEAGPFTVSVWSLPNPLVTGDVNFIVAVAETRTFNGQEEAVVVLDADVDLLLTAADGEEISVSASHQNATNKLFYEAYFELPEAGDWDAVITINYDGQSGSVPFTVTADSPPFNINWTLIGGIAIVIIAVGWFIWQSRQHKELAPVSDET